MFAKIYADQMEDVDYSLIFKFIINYINKTDTILDAGCGPGYLVNEFLLNDYNIIGVDNDEEMLSYAVNILGLFNKVFNHDLNDPIELNFDVIISIFDVVNYFEDVTQYFTNVYDALNKNGKFIFDIYTLEAINKMTNYNENLENIDWNINIDNNKIIHTIKTETNDNYEIVQYFYETKHYVNILKKLGFKLEVITGPDIRKSYIIATK